MNYRIKDALKDHLYFYKKKGGRAIYVAPFPVSEYDTVLTWSRGGGAKIVEKLAPVSPESPAVTRLININEVHFRVDHFHEDIQAWVTLERLFVGIKALGIIDCSAEYLPLPRTIQNYIKTLQERK